MKNALLLMLSGALAGAVIASFIVPPMLSWYATPGLPQGAAIPSLVQVPDVIRSTVSRLLWGQAIGAGLGAVGGLALSLAFRRRPTAVVAPPPAR
ncbi:MAG: hypothetical protein U0Q55_14365 [Vicinamibacterales bacterium]